MAFSRRLLRWIAAGIGLLLVLVVLGVGGLSLWLDHSPQLGREVVARVTAMTGLQFQFASIDARLGFYGPELVFREAQLLSRTGGEPVITARAGRVGLDWWRSLRTGHLLAGRVTLDAPQLSLLVTDDGVQLVGSAAFRQRRADAAAFTLDQLPTGRVVITDATVQISDARGPATQWRLEQVHLDLTRNAHSVDFDGRAQLPSVLGDRLALSGRLDGELATPEKLQWRGEVTLNDLQLNGVTALLTPSLQSPLALPSAGRGDLTLEFAGTGRVPVLMRADADFAGVVLPPATPGAAGVRYRRLAGDLKVRHDGDDWQIVGKDLDLDPGARGWHDGQLKAFWRLQGQTLQSAQLVTPLLPLEALAPLVALVPAGSVHDVLVQLAPRGQLSQVDIRLGRAKDGTSWAVDGGLKFAGLQFNAVERVPGVAGLSGELQGDGLQGRADIRATAFSLSLPRYLRAPALADRGSLTLDWWWQADGLRLATDTLYAAFSGGDARGTARLWLPLNGDSPVVALQAKVQNLNVKDAPHFIPSVRLPPKTRAWLDSAFVAGRVTTGRLELTGQLRRFPFRDGGGELRATAHVVDAQLHYGEGWADVMQATGDATFLNQGFSATLQSATLNGMSVTSGHAEIADFRGVELAVTGQVRGDLKAALDYLQRAPVGPKLGTTFMGLKGSGPFVANADILLPFRHFYDRRIDVRTELNGATVQVKGIDEPLTGLRGALRVNGIDVNTDADGIVGAALGGPVKVTARTTAGRGELERVTLIQASGRVQGARLRPVAKLPTAVALNGAADWRGQVRLARLLPPKPVTVIPDPAADAPPIDNPPDAPTVEEPPSELLPVNLRVESTLTGLAIGLPAPLGKSAEETRPLTAEVMIDPKGATVAHVQLGRDAGAFEWANEPTLTLKRGTVRMGGGSAELKDRSRIWVEGRLPEFDLSAWLKVKSDKPSGRRLQEFLGGAEVTVDRLTVFGYEFPRVVGRMTAQERGWQIDVDGPAADGRVQVPYDIPGPEPLQFDMDRLIVGDHNIGSGDGAVDPTQFPPIRFDTRLFEFQKRRLGWVQAELVRTPTGLRMTQVMMHGTSFTASGTGEWNSVAGAQRCQVDMRIASKDVADTLEALNFAPSVSAKEGEAHGELNWPGPPDGTFIERLSGKISLKIEKGQIVNLTPGAGGRVVGLMSIVALPRRLSLDFSDLTDKGLAFDTITGDFELTSGNAMTRNLLLDGPAAKIGIIGRTGLKDQDYDQVAAVSGNLGGSIAAAGALAGGPIVGGALLLFSTLFKEPLSGIARSYYKITGSWDQPKVERLSARDAQPAETASTVPPAAETR